LPACVVSRYKRGVCGLRQFGEAAADFGPLSNTATRLLESTAPACVAGAASLSAVLETRDLGMDPVFAPVSALYDATLDTTVCHPYLLAKTSSSSSGGSSGSSSSTVAAALAAAPSASMPAGFPFVRFPSEGGGWRGRGLLDVTAWVPDWAPTLERLRDAASEPSFFDLGQLTAEEAESVDGAHPLFFDNNFDRARVERLLAYAEDGLYLSDGTPTTTTTTPSSVASAVVGDAASGFDELRVQMLLFNQELARLLLVSVTLQREAQGTVLLTKDTAVLDPSVYDSRAPRHAGGIVLHAAYFALLVLQVALNGRDACKVARASGRSCAHFDDPWNYISLAAAALQVVCWGFFFGWVSTSTAFAPRWRYDVYDVVGAADVGSAVVRVGTSTANSNTSTSTSTSGNSSNLALCPNADLARFNAVELTELRLQLKTAEHASGALEDLYVSVLVLVALLIWGLLQVLHFQPRLNVVTRTITIAAGELFHWAILFTMGMIGQAVMLWQLCGARVPQLSTLGSTVEALLRSLFGDDDLVGTLMTQLGPLSAAMWCVRTQSCRLSQLVRAHVRIVCIWRL
jgi:hypothetical protein